MKQPYKKALKITRSNIVKKQITGSTLAPGGAHCNLLKNHIKKQELVFSEQRNIKNTG